MYIVNIWQHFYNVLLSYNSCQSFSSNQVTQHQFDKITKRIVPYNLITVLLLNKPLTKHNVITTDWLLTANQCW